MAVLKHVTTLVSKKSAYSNNITDLEVVDTAEGKVLVAVSNIEAGLTSYALSTADAPATGVAREAPLTYGTYFSAPKLEVISGADDTYKIVITGQQGSVHTGLLMGGEGLLHSYVSPFSPTQIPGSVVTMSIFDIAGTDYMLAGTDGSLSLQLFRLNANLSAAKIDTATPGVRVNTDAEYTDIEVVRVGSKTFAYAASAQGNLMGIYEVGASGLTTRGAIDRSNVIGISAPREVEAVTTAHGQFLIVTGGSSDSLTVFRITATGALTLADHVVDSATTRFEAATAIATVEMGGRAYILVGGGDDGISIFTMDGQGRLILLDVLADNDGITLANVSAIEATHDGGKIAVFVASATETGITQLSYDPGPISRSLVGSGKLNGSSQDDILVGTGTSSVLAGGQGDDILIARSGVVTMKGGTGDDIFVPCYDTSRVTILDYDPASDRLDLSELAYIRSIAQLQVLPTATGAILVAGEVRIEIRTVNGTSLQPADFKENMFRLAHYANDIDYSDLVTPVTPGPEDPTSPTPPTGGSGGYVAPAALPSILSVSKQILGTSDANRITLPGSGGKANGLAGNDRIIGASTARCNMFGDKGNDTISGGSRTDYIFGGDGNDSIAGGGGHDSLNGGEGNDYIFGGAGDDRIHGGTGRNNLIGDKGNDVIISGGTSGSTMRGGSGSDMIRGYGGIDTILAGSGHDRIYVGGNKNVVSGNEGNDLIKATGAGNKLDGGSGNDSVFGGAGRDSVFGGVGDDRVHGGGGNDLVTGHDGNDMLYGDDGNDHVIGMNGNDLVMGGRGNDIVWGQDGNDTMRGHVGNDSLRGGAGRDTMHGDDGNDEMLGGTGRDKLYGGLGDDFMSGNEDNDTVFGDDGDDRIEGSSGNDLLDGGNGNDRVMGGSGHDVVQGAAGSDVLGGGDGNDTLHGGVGNDTLTGGAGEDVFVFVPHSSPGVQSDTITDFQTGVDVIDLSDIAASIVWMGTSGFSGRGRTEVCMQKYSDRTRLLIDLDGDGDTDMAINVYGSAVTPFDLLS